MLTRLQHELGRAPAAQRVSAAVVRATETPLVDDARISPDGQMVAFVVADTWRVPGDPARSSVFVVSSDGRSAPRMLPGTQRAARMPRWRPAPKSGVGGEGGVLAFVEHAGGETLVCVHHLEEGTTRTLVRFPGPMSALEWSLDGSSLALLHTDPPPHQSSAAGEDIIRVDAADGWTRLWMLDADTGDCEAVSPPGLQIWEFDWAPDGRTFAVVAAGAPGEGSWYQTWLATLGRDGRLSGALYRTHRQVVRPVWSPDGRWIAFLSCLLSDRDVGSGDVWIVPADGGPARNLTDGYAGTPTWIAWKDPTTLVVTGHEDCDAFIATISVDGRLRELWRDHAALGHHRWPRFSMAVGGQPLAAVREAWDRPLDVWISEPDGESLRWRQVTDLHPYWNAWPLGPADVVTWPADDGLEMRGIVLYPPGDAPGHPLPMVTAVHGGPTNLWSCRPYLLWHRLLTMMGAAVFLPNPRGSTGRGVAFAEANHADYGGGDWRDIMAGVDALVARGLADSDRLGIGGWSYGGFMTAWAVTQTTRFRAGVLGAGISNWVSFHGTTPLHIWDAASFDADPYRDAPHVRFSPITHVDRARTPTLMVHGQADTVVPPGQSQEFFRALRDRGVPAELYLYPRESHFFGEQYHQRHMYQRTLDWFAGYLELDAGALLRIPRQ